MVLVIGTFLRTGVLKEECFRTGTRGGIEVQVDIRLPANPDLHGSNHESRRAGRSGGEGVARDPVREFNVPADPEHFDFGLLRVKRPAAGGGGRLAWRLPKGPERGGQVAGKAGQLAGALLEEQAPETGDL